MCASRSHFIGLLKDNEDSQRRYSHNRRPLPFLPTVRWSSSRKLLEPADETTTASTTNTTDLNTQAADVRSSMRERANNMRDSARDHYRDFRDHPGESAMEGAKSFGGMVQQYGPVFIGTYLGVYFTTLGVLFFGVESGIMDPVSLFNMLGHTEATGESKNTVSLVIEFLEHYEFTARYVPLVERRPEVANLAVAWIAVKFTEPLRLPVALAITPRIARYFGMAPPAVVAEDGKRDSKESDS